MNQFSSLRSGRTATFCALATIAAAVAGGVMWNRHLNAAPTFAIPAPPPLPNPNAFDDFVRAAKLHHEPDIYRSGGKTVTLTPAQIDAVFADNAAAVEALHVGFTHPFLMPDARSGKDMGGFQYFSQFRSLARVLCYEAQQRAVRGDAAGATEAGLDCVQIGVMLPRGGNGISLLVGIACDAIGRKNLWSLVGKIDAAQAASAARRLESLDARRTPFAENLEEEKWQGVTARLELLRKQSVTTAYRQTVQSWYNGDSDSDSANAAGAPNHPFRDWVSLATLSKQQVVDNYVAWMDAQIAAFRLPYNQPGASSSSPAAPPVPVDLFNRAIEGMNLAGGGESSESRIQFKDAADRTDDGLLTTLLALRAYRLQTGGYPATLDALVTSGILRALPTDPFARAANTPFGYRRLSDDQFRLYSVGPDGIDDGGRPIDLTRGPSSRAKSAVPYVDAADKGDWVVGVDLPAPGSGAG